MSEPILNKNQDTLTVERVTLNETGNDVVDWVNEEPMTDKKLSEFLLIGPPFSD
jgi:hypothetical protein